MGLRVFAHWAFETGNEIERLERGLLPQRGAGWPPFTFCHGFPAMQRHGIRGSRRQTVEVAQGHARPAGDFHLELDIVVVKKYSHILKNKVVSPTIISRRPRVGQTGTPVEPFAMAGFQPDWLSSRTVLSSC